MNDSSESLSQIVMRASELMDPSERAAYLDQVCGGGTELRRQVEQRLNGNGDQAMLTAEDAPLDVEHELQLDELCIQFERQWQEASPPTPMQFSRNS